LEDIIIFKKRFNKRSIILNRVEYHSSEAIGVASRGFDVTDLITRLVEMAHPNGGWGYRPGQTPHLEPTCWAMLALMRHKSNPGIRAAYDLAHNRFLPDQLVTRSGQLLARLQRGRPQAAWPTALVLTLWSNGHATRSECDALADGLLSIEGRVMKADPEVAEMVDIDVRLMGWPWAEDTFSWVEPTSWACVALRKVGRGSAPRVREGLRLLLDRAFDTGGANYGNRVVLGRPTEPIPGTSAALLLALQGVDHPRVEAAKGYLRLHGEQSTDVEHLAWIMIALACHANDEATRAALPKLDARMRESLTVELADTSGLGAGPLRLALASLARTSHEWNPFLLTDRPQIAEQPQFADRANKQVPKQEARGIGDRVKGFVRGVMVKGLSNIRPLPLTSGVHIAKCDTYDGPLVDTLKSQFASFREHVSMKDKRVVLKPNIVEYHQGKVINTDPRVIDATIQLCKDEGAKEIIVAEGPGHWRNVQYLVNACGLGDVLRKHGVKFVDINHDEPVKHVNLGRTTGLEYLYLSQTIVSAEVLISMPKLKTHHWACATLSLKNLFGTLPGICYGWPKNELHWRGIPNSIVDIACTNTPHLAIVDGIVGMEGDGPLNGTAKPMGVLVMGVDLLAVDATCCRIMKLPVERIPTLVLAQLKRLGNLEEAKIPQLGESIATVAQAFQWPPKIEEHLMPDRSASATAS
jgi:uncharacterized protein (DUF362 family)